MRLIVLLAAGVLIASGMCFPGVEARAQTPDSLSIADATPDTSDVAGVPQRDVWDLFFHKKDTDGISEGLKIGLSWAILPTFSYNPVYGAAFGLMATGAGQRGFRGARFSSLSVSGNYSTTGQVQFQFRTDLFSPSGEYLTRADFRYLDTERSTWGLGPMNTNQQEHPMTFVLYRAYATVYRVVSGPVFVGLGYHYDEFNDIVDERAAQGEQTPFTVYSGGPVKRTVASGFSINLLGDTRDNLVNAASGYYLSLSFRNYTKVAGSDANWQEMWTEMRVYPHVPKRSKNVLAFWLYSWFTFGPAPYLNLPANGWDTYGRSSRGYLQGRIRSSNLVYLESEYRVPVSRDGLWGAVAFLNFTCATNQQTQTFGKADLGGGLGLRVKFNKRSNTNLSIDYGWGRLGSNGVFLGMSEVF